MRSFLLTVLCFAGLPLCLIRPYFGLLFFSWMAYMRPQDMTWGFASTFQWSKFIAILMLVGIFFNNKEKFFRPVPINWMVIFLWIFISISVVFSVDVPASMDRYIEYTKIFLIAIVTIGLINTRDRLKITILAMVTALGFHGTKSGLFGLLQSGSIKRGPGGMLEDNNDFALALVMTVPLLFYMGTMQTKKKFTVIPSLVWLFAQHYVFYGLTLVVDF